MDLSSRYFKNEAEPIFQPHEELLASLTRISNHNPPVQTCSTSWEFHGLYRGPTSIAYLFFRLQHYYPDLEFKGQSLLQWAVAYLRLGDHVRHPEVKADYCGISNETLARLAMRAAIYKDHSLARELCAYADVINDGNYEGSDGWLSGRAGYLYFLRFARTIFGDNPASVTDRTLFGTIQRTTTRILLLKQSWTWDGRMYLGATHGLIGIVAQLIMSDSITAVSLEMVVTQLLKWQFPSGNFPASLPTGPDDLVQFCHGGPGFVVALNTIRPYFPRLQTEIDQAIWLARKDIWKRGLLTKTPCLCHGIAGNALAFSNDEKFNHFLACMTSEMLENLGWMADAGKNETFASLYCGEAGRAWVWAIADKKLDKTFIGFNDI